MSLSDRLSQARRGRELAITTPVSDAVDAMRTRNAPTDPYFDIKRSVHTALLESLVNYHPELQDAINDGEVG